MGRLDTGNLPLPSALDQLEAAALQLLQAVRALKGSSLPNIPASSFSLPSPAPRAVTLGELCNTFLVSKAKAEAAAEARAKLVAFVPSVPVTRLTQPVGARLFTMGIMPLLSSPTMYAQSIV